jgi:hypothetical protein
MQEMNRSATRILYIALLYPDVGLKLWQNTVKSKALP